MVCSVQLAIDVCNDVMPPALSLNPSASMRQEDCVLTSAFYSKGTETTACAPDV